MSDSEDERLAIEDGDAEESSAEEDFESEEDEDDDFDDEDDEGVETERTRREGMHWLNEPEEWSQHRTTVMMKAPSHSNFWRKTMTGKIEDSATFYFLDVEGDFEARVKVKAGFDTSGDQAGIMVREDAENWIKCGIQMIDDVPHMCTTITHDWSDMSMHPLPTLPEYMWVHAKKIGDGLEVYISEDSFDWMQIRQGDIVDDRILEVGLYCASPNSDGFDVTFEDFMIKDEQ